MRGHITKRESGKWAVVVDVGRDPDTGRRKQKWLSGFRTRAEAEDALVELLGRRQRGEVIDPDKTLLADYLTTWLAGRADKLAPLSSEQYARIIKNHIRGSAFGAMPLGKIRRAHVRAFEQTLRQKGVGAPTMNVVRAVISRALTDAVEDDLLFSNPARGARQSGDRTQAPKRFTVWTAEELRSLLDVSARDRLAALWRLAVASGARRGELLGCTWLGFSADQATVTIAQQVVPERGGTAIRPCKTKGSHRTIRLDAATVAALEAHREDQLCERDAAGDAYEDRDLIFCDELGRPINPQRLTARFGQLRAESGLRPGRLHDVRHSHATHLLTAGVPVHIVSARLGHASPMITMTTYAHVLPRSDEHAAEVMAGVLG